METCKPVDWLRAVKDPVLDRTRNRVPVTGRSHHRRKPYVVKLGDSGATSGTDGVVLCDSGTIRYSGRKSFVVQGPCLRPKTGQKLKPLTKTHSAFNRYPTPTATNSTAGGFQRVGPMCPPRRRRLKPTPEIKEGKDRSRYTRTYR